MVAYLLFIPTILALYVALRRSAEAVMAVGPAAIPLYFAAIVFLLAWVVLVGRRLYQLGA